MRRRDFIVPIGGAAALPISALAQRGETMRRVGVLYGGVENDPLVRAITTTFRDALAKLGWVEQRNLRLDIHYAGGDAGLMRMYAAELVSLNPDVIFTPGGGMRAARQQTQTIPIVFSGGGDVFESGLVKNVARPEGNITGIANRYASMYGKSVELLREAVPGLQKIGLIYDARRTFEDNPQFGATEEAARVFAVEAVGLPFRNAVDLVHGIDEFAAQPNGGLYILPPPPTVENRETIFQLATRHRLPTLSALGFIPEGCLMAYDADSVEDVPRAASYVDRILRGAKPNDLPVQFPTRFELTVNLKTAKAIGITISESFLLRADEVIE